MASRGSSGKAAHRRRGSGAARSSRARSGSASSRSPTRRQKPAGLHVSLRPDHQRELFALALITIALVTLIFFLTGVTGGVGSVYVLVVQQVFGGGALVVPLALGFLGIAILIQERFYDTQFAGSHVIGTLLVLGMLLAILEFPHHDLALSSRLDEGGGWLGYHLVHLLDSTIGRPAAMAVVGMAMLAGLLLTFNVTLREVVPGGVALMQTMWQVAWSGPRRLPGEESVAPVRTGTAPAGGDVPDEVVLTPIAERPTKASLFRRPEGGREAMPAPVALPPPALPNGKGNGNGNGSGWKFPNSLPAPPVAGFGSAAPPPALPEPARTPKKVPELPAPVQGTLDEVEAPVIYRAWPLPSLDILDQPVRVKANDEEHMARMARLIEETLASFKVEAQVIGRHTGPAITQFELQPAVGVKISKITTLDRDLALALAAPSIRIEAPIPGKSAIGIEIPNTAIALVTLREVIDSEAFEAHRGKLRLPLGKDVSGTPMVADMARMPHLLVAGSTGSGKSVAINAFLCGLLLRHTPEELKLILVDPKMVELIVYNRIPHLLSPVVTELERVLPTLKWATREMERRYKVFARLGCRNLEGYQKRSRTQADLEPMPYIVIVIDELADLMMMAPDDVETQVCRLAQMARATGIHLIIATQRPSVDVLTGLIKANFPSRIAFAVTSQVDSRVILDTPGAERLLGRGDMLYMAADAAKLVRIQGTFVSDREVEQIVSFWRTSTPPGEGAKRPMDEANEAAAPTDRERQQRAALPGSGGVPRQGAAGGEEETVFQPPAASFLSVEEQEMLLPQAVDLVSQHKRASASLLQRRLRIGYSKAAQLIDLLEQQGVVGPAEEGRSREVLRRREA
ncbi:MAG: DNA translocase FtsK [Chloroflexaceae bacterium]|nr:DNA translocase FtsK [Chloroflexaceae bacterium]